MEEKAKDIWQKVKGTVGGLSKTVKGIIIAGIVITLVVIAIVLANGSKTEYRELFTGLTDDDMAKVCAYLNENQATFEVKGENTIMVPADQEAKLKAGVIAGGYLTSGSGYSLYLDNISSLSTESDRAQLNLYQLQDRLEETIRNFVGVHDATVNIALGEDRRYVLSQENTIEASASVVVTMADEAPINAKLAESIRNTVGYAVKGLIIDNVDIRDSLGNHYDGTDGGDISDVAAKRMEIEDSVNKRLTKQVLGVLEPIYGVGNVTVAVNTTVSMSSEFSESTKYDQPDWAKENADGEGIIGRMEWNGFIGYGDEAEGGTVGTETNADLNEYVQNPDLNGNEQELQASGKKEFNNDKTVTQSQRMAGYIEDVTVSVTINSNVSNQVSIDALVDHVANAVGLTGANDADKISVLTAPFWAPEPSAEPTIINPIEQIFGGMPLWVYLALLAGLFLFMTLFAVFVLLGRRRTRGQVQLEPAVDMGPELESIVEELPEPTGADIMDVHTEKSMELRRSVRELAENNPEIAAQAIKALLRGDEEANA